MSENNPRFHSRRARMLLVSGSAVFALAAGIAAVPPTMSVSASSSVTGVSVTTEARTGQFGLATARTAAENSASPVLIQDQAVKKIPLEPLKRALEWLKKNTPKLVASRWWCKSW